MTHLRKLMTSWTQWWWFARGKRCKLNDSRLLIYTSPFRYFSVGREDIVRWQLIPEMGADFIQLELRDGTFPWVTDRWNDVIEGLKSLVPDKKFGNGFDVP